MSKEQEDSVIDKINHLLDEKDQVVFTKKEIEILKSMAKVWVALETLGDIGSVIRNILLYFGVMIGIWLTVKGEVINWIVSLKP